MKTFLLIVALMLSQEAAHTQVLFSKVFSAGDSTIQQPVQLHFDTTANSFLLLQNESAVSFNSVSELLYFNANADLVWAKKFVSADSTGNNPFFYNINPANDGWFLAGSSSNKGVLLKLDTAFRVVWFEKFSLNLDSNSNNHTPEMGFSKLLETDKGLLVLGNYGRGHGVDRDSLLVLSLQKDGTNPSMVNVEFYQKEGTSPQIKENYAVNIFQNTSKKYFLFTSSGSEDINGLPGEAASPEVTVLDTSLRFLSSKKFTLNYSANLVSVLRLNDGHYLLTGNGSKKFYLMKLDSLLNVNWIKTYHSETVADSNDYIAASSVVQTNNGFMVAGAKYFPITSHQAAWIMTTDTAGNPVQSNLVAVDTPSAGAVENLLPWAGNTVIMTSIIPFDTFNDLLLMNSDSNAATSCNFQSEPLIVLSDSLKALAADTPLVSTVTDYSFENVKLNITNINFTVNDKCSMTSSVNNFSAANNEVKIFPQPASNIVSILIPEMKNGNKTILSVYNSAGAQVMSEETKANLITFQAGNFPSGLYLIKLNRGASVQYSKFIIQH